MECLSFSLLFLFFRNELLLVKGKNQLGNHRSPQITLFHSHFLLISVSLSLSLLLYLTLSLLLSQPPSVSLYYFLPPPPPPPPSHLFLSLFIEFIFKKGLRLFEPTIIIHRFLSPAVPEYPSSDTSPPPSSSPFPPERLVQ